MKDQSMIKQLFVPLALAGGLFVSNSSAISLDDIQLWTGSGTNRAALVIEWSTPESLVYSSVPVPVADKTLVWGYRFNGPATATQMFNAIVAANPGLYAVEAIYPFYGTSVEAIGYNFQGVGPQGLTDGTVTDLADAFVNGILMDASLNLDAAYSLNPGDLYWGAAYGANWETWNELGDAGGFWASPNRGPNEFWTTTDPVNFYTGYHGQWEFAQASLDYLPLTNGSWIAFSVAAGEYESATNAPYNIHKHAPPSPDGTYVAYVANPNDFAVQVISTNGLDPRSLYDDPTAVLGRPTVQFLDGAATNRVSIVDPPYNVAPDGSNVLAVVDSGGQITVQLGRKIYHSPNNPYGVDFIVYGNPMFEVSGNVSDATDLNATTLLDDGVYGHPTVVAVSQDGIHWYTNNPVPALFPQNAYRWDDTNDSWTFEQMNPTKPLNPVVYTNDFTGEPVAGVLDQYAGAAGGTGYSLQGSGWSWIQYVQVRPPAGAYTVIDAIAAVNPVVVGDALTITPDNLTAGITNLDFQNPANPAQNLLTLNIDAVSGNTRVSTAALSEFSAYGPVTGTAAGACEIQVRPVSGPGPVTLLADAGLSVAAGYAGNGGDLRVYQWNCTNWTSLPFAYNATNQQVWVTGLTNFSVLVVSQIIPPPLTIQNDTNHFAFQFTPLANATHILQRSTDLTHWTPVATNTPTTALPVTMLDNAPPAGMAFYRLSITVP
jgi:hypothetical protein